MEERNLIEKLGRVGAPPGFERRVLVELGLRKEQRRGVRRAYPLAYAGAAAFFLAAVVLVDVLVLERPGRTVRAGLDKAVPAASAPVPVMETMDYASEVRNASYEPRTIYILEQVSEVSPREITY